MSGTRPSSGSRKREHPARTPEVDDEEREDGPEGGGDTDDEDEEQETSTSSAPGSIFDDDTGDFDLGEDDDFDDDDDDGGTPKGESDEEGEEAEEAEEGGSEEEQEVEGEGEDAEGGGGGGSSGVSATEGPGGPDVVSPYSTEWLKNSSVRDDDDVFFWQKPARTPEEAERHLKRREINDEDSSDEEVPNTIGNVPLEWYADMDHIGYDLEGEPIPKQEGALTQLDTISQFLAKKDDPDYWRTIRDEARGRDIKLSDEDVALIKSVMHNATPASLEEFGGDSVGSHLGTRLVPSIHPVGTAIPSKKGFIPSKIQAKKIARLANAMRRGWIAIDPKPKPARFYDVWQAAETAPPAGGRATSYLPPPPRRVPGNAESYNPPEEYIPSASEIDKAWKKWRYENTTARTPDIKSTARLETDRTTETPFIPKRCDRMLHIPVYANTVRDAFERCLDLMCCPRQPEKPKKRSKRINSITDLLPKLPHPTELRPFPSHCVITFQGHTASVTSISVHPSGEWLASASLDHTLRIWEVSTGRCVRLISFKGDVRCVQWNPNPNIYLLAVALDQSVLFISVGNLPTPPSFIQNTSTKRDDTPIPPPPPPASGSGTPSTLWAWENLSEKDMEGELNPDKTESEAGEPVPTLLPTYDNPRQLRVGMAQWEEGPELCGRGVRNVVTVRVRHNMDVSKVSWHSKGDYLVAVSPSQGKSAIVVHQVSTRRSQNPFKKPGTKGKGESHTRIREAKFHPTKPYLVVVTVKYVRIYDVVKKKLVMKIKAPPSQPMITSVALHKSGDHVIMGSHTGRISWFDLDLSTEKPYKVVKPHSRTVRQVCFHPGAYPLFASCSDDKSVQVFHSTVFNDYLKNPLIVPLVVLKGHGSTRLVPRDQPNMFNFDGGRVVEGAVPPDFTTYHPSLPASVPAPASSSSSSPSSSSKPSKEATATSSSSATATAAEKKKSGGDGDEEEEQTEDTLAEAGGVGVGVTDMVFHPHQPWLFTCGSDARIFLYADCI
ncbi:ribosome biogenesis protein BOP1 [Pelomyxa schiedti]|nr:ribosome biogenesis protein BOP1 [Pelomyxa schiedti]